VIPLAFVIAVAIATLLVLVVAAVSLARQTKRVVGSIVAFQAELEPIVREIQGDADRASERLARLQQEPLASGEGIPKRDRRVVPVDPDAPTLPG
jgi:hypothetical protein